MLPPRGLDENEQIKLIEGFRSSARRSDKVTRLGFVGMSALLVGVTLYLMSTQVVARSGPRGGRSLAAAEGRVTSESTAGNTPLAQQVLMNMLAVATTAVGAIRMWRFNPERHWREHVSLAGLSRWLPALVALFALGVQLSASTLLHRGDDEEGTLFHMLFHDAVGSLLALLHAVAAPFVTKWMCEVQREIELLAGKKYQISKV